MEIKYLLAHTPLAAGRQGFPKEEGKPYLPGRLLRESLETALFFYALGKDPEFAELVRVFLLAGKFERIASVRDFLLERLRERYEEVAALELPEKIFLPDITSRRILTVDLENGEIVRRGDHQVFIGVLPLELDLPGIFKYAGLSFCEALARAELRRLRETIPSLVPFYEGLTNRLRRMTVCLRTGYWTDDVFGGLLLAYWRVKEVREVIRRRLREDPAPRTLLYSPKDKATLGWIELTDEI
ncbi:MAG: hypothetical protein GXO17_01365 [Thermodesulfobacteria bacterium]|nr:hypothetical protein [Thermodesulfobacteriota bacterium]